MKKDSDINEKKIYWKSTYGFSDKKYMGIVYKCPKIQLEEHDLRISNIEECEKCTNFKGIKYDDWKKISLYCDYHIK